MVETSKDSLYHHKKLHRRVVDLERDNPSWGIQLGRSDLDPAASDLAHSIEAFLDAVEAAAGATAELQQSNAFQVFLVPTTPSMGFTGPEVRQAGVQLRGELETWQRRAMRLLAHPIRVTFDEAVRGLPEHNLEPIPESTMYKYASNPSYAEILGMKARQRPRDKTYDLEGLKSLRARKVSENLRRETESSGERQNPSS
ncbi:MAG: hypothetical protein KAI24_08865 [Planctomycetes bacterium]|nr:hypothetical protein [Planctomycetota bacterium]